MRELAKNAHIAPYTGEKRTRDQITQRYGTDTGQYVLCRSDAECLMLATQTLVWHALQTMHTVLHSRTMLNLQLVHRRAHRCCAQQSRYPRVTKFSSITAANIGRKHFHALIHKGTCQSNSATWSGGSVKLDTADKKQLVATPQQKHNLSIAPNRNV